MCIQPITKQIRSSKYSAPFSIKIPCGKCLECLRDRQNEWVVRLFMESKYHSNILFFTLTYSPQSVPELVDQDGVVYKSVFKKHLQDWFKRFRQRYKKTFGENAQLKYFITSEYGPKTKRPHYHGLIFGIPLKVFNELALSEWRSQFGFVDVSEIRMSSDMLQRDKDLSNVMRYVGKYCMKGEFENPFVEQKKVLPSFRLISKGIGLQYTNDIKNYVLYGKNNPETSQSIDYTFEGIESIVTRSQIRVGKYYYSLPTYSKRIIYGQKTLLSFLIGQYLLNRDDDLYREKFAQLQTAWNSCDIQTFRIMELQQSTTKQIKVDKLRSQFAQIYTRSKI